MLDRTTPPDYQIPRKFELKEAERTSIENGIDMFVVNSGKQEIIRLELIFDCGIWDEFQPLAASYCAKMLREGTRSKSSEDIAEIFDKHGAFLKISAGYDHTIISLYLLPKHLGSLLPLLQEMILEPTFPEDEISVLKVQSIQNLKVNLEKNSYVATTTFKEHLFGPEHPYGRKLKQDHIHQIRRSAIEKFYNEVFIKSKIDIHLSGKITESDRQKISKYFNDLPLNKEKKREQKEISTSDKKYTLIEKENSLQSSLRVGSTAIQKQHPDYIRLLATNELLGGFFGARLMKNIREDKGYTYGIYSQLKSLVHETIFMIGVDVKKQYRENAIQEINKEIKQLCTSPPGDRELNTLRNYLTGSFQTEIDSPFALSDKFKAVYYHGLDYSYYDHLHEIILGLNKKDVTEMANKYLDPKQMVTVCVG